MAAAKEQVAPVVEGVAPEAKPYSETLKIAAFAETGARKTLQIGHLIEAYGVENVGIISCERGLGTIRSLLDERFIKVAEDRNGLREAWKWAKETFTDPVHQWVCVDGGSRVLQWIRDDVFGGTQKAYELLLSGYKATDLPAAVRPYAMYVTGRDEVNTQAMWTRIGVDADILLNSFIRLPSNLYWTFWEEMTNVDQYRKAPPWRPDTPGKGSLDAVKGTFDFIFRLVNDGDAATAYTKNSPLNYAKVRDDWRGVKVPDTIPNFNLASFAAYMLGKSSTLDDATAT